MRYSFSYEWETAAIVIQLQYGLSRFKSIFAWCKPSIVIVKIYDVCNIFHVNNYVISRVPKYFGLFSDLFTTWYHKYPLNKLTLFHKNNDLSIVRIIDSYHKRSLNCDNKFWISGNASLHKNALSLLLPFLKNIKFLLKNAYRNIIRILFNSI